MRKIQKNFFLLRFFQLNLFLITILMLTQNTASYLNSFFLKRKKELQAVLHFCSIKLDFSIFRLRLNYDLKSSHTDEEWLSYYRNLYFQAFLCKVQNRKKNLGDNRFHPLGCTFLEVLLL